MTKEQIEEEISDIEGALACDDSVGTFSFSLSEATERLGYLKGLLTKF